MNESITLISLMSTTIKFILLLFLNLAISAIGFIPSFFVTAINIDSLGLLLGVILTFTGEIFGAIIGFNMYRWGFSKINPGWLSHTIFKTVKNSSPMLVFILIILSRFLPLIPSGIVTAGASLTTITGWRFMFASSIGKVPAVTIEVAIVLGVLQKISINYFYGVTILLLVIFTTFWIIKKR
ncbi:Uncharacterized membrane protein YdjX, TVP38/TMEM64 family, SNARE-associated domain [Paenisporosarcina quisquiliarum]|nr:Uncharacterized membrane protein YdjX, TVP38/TMEM64 family, SNARE-associated domain [Paenisporosarcina quisquiliarum]